VRISSVYNSELYMNQRQSMKEHYFTSLYASNARDFSM